MEELYKAFGDVTVSTALASRNGKIVPGSKETTAKERNSALVITCGVTVRHTKAVGKKIKWQGSALTHGPTKNSSLESGLTLRCQDSASNNGPTASATKDSTPAINDKASAFLPCQTLALLLRTLMLARG
jgi:hypothetical protein